LSEEAGEAWWQVAVLASLVGEDGLGGEGVEQTAQAAGQHAREVGPLSWLCRTFDA